MPSIMDDTGLAAAKMLIVGKSGAGKTGTLAVLVCLGYRIRMIDTDKGIRLLRALLTDPRYPYASIIAERGINLTEAVRYVPIDIAMKLRTISVKKPNGNTTSETLLAPMNANAWPKVLTLMDNWKEEDGTELGSVTTWGHKDVLVIDSLSTLAKCVYYFSQSMNGRLGARDSGYDYQRDVGEAQSQLTRLLELLYSSTIICNVIVISHITWVDESQGVAAKPKVAANSDDGAQIISNPDGYPSAIGRALSPHIGKYFNDSYIVRAEGTGASVRRTISTVPQDGVIAKSSVFLDREYPVSYGLAAIFSALRNEPLPPGFVDKFTGRPRVSDPKVSDPSTNTPKARIPAPPSV